MSNESEQVLDLERRRAAAIGKGDLEALSDCLAEDYFHVFGGGRTCGKAAYIKTIEEGPRAPERGVLTVRLYDNVAVLTGDLLNKIEQKDGGVRVVDAIRRHGRRGPLRRSADQPSRLAECFGDSGPASGRKIVGFGAVDQQAVMLDEDRVQRRLSAFAQQDRPAKAGAQAAIE